MGVLLKAKREIFAQAVASGKTAKEAYIEAGYKYHPAAPAKLLQSPVIKARVQELIQERSAAVQEARLDAAQRLGIDKYFVLKELMDIRDVSRKPRLLKPATKDKPAVYGAPTSLIAWQRAVEMMGKEIGMFREQLEIGGVGEFTAMNDTELLNKAIRDARALGATDADIERIRELFSGPVIEHEPTAE